MGAKAVQERFMEVVEKLDLRFPVADIHRKTNYSKGAISEYLNKKKVVTGEFLKKFSDGYLVNYNWLETGEGEMFLKSPDGATPERVQFSNHGFAEFYDEVDETMQKRWEKENAGYLLNRVEAFTAREFADFYANRFGNAELTAESIKKAVSDFRTAALAFYGE